MSRSRIAVLVGFLLVVLPALCLGQSISDDSLQASSQDSMQQSSQDSSQDSLQTSSQDSSQTSSDESSQYTSDNSLQYTTDETTGVTSQGTIQATTDGTLQLDDASAVTLVVGGAVVAVGLTVIGITYLVEVSEAEQEEVVAFQDQIYSADGPDYRRVIDGLGVTEGDLVQANDEIVAEGFVIESDQDAADYLGALMLRLAEKSPVIKANASSTFDPTG